MAVDHPDFPHDSLTAHRRQLEFDFLLSERFDQWMETIHVGQLHVHAVLTSNG
jgi:hypothetical protein